MHRTRQAAGVATIILVAAIGTGLGCGGNTPPATSATTSATTASAQGSAAGTEPGEDEEGAQLYEHHRHHHGGVAMFLSMSLDSLGLSDAEKAQVEKVQGDLWTKVEPSHTAQHDVLAILADGVAAGNVDKAKVDAAIAQLDATYPAVHAATNDALDQLHAILQPPERAALVQKLEAHWQVWQEANAEGEAQGDAKKKRGDHFSAMSRDLNLTPDQVDRLRTALHGAPPESGKKVDSTDASARLQAFGTAFTADSFQAKSLSGGEGLSLGLPSHGIRRMARFYEAAAPVLTPEQRTKASARLREHANQESGK